MPLRRSRRIPLMVFGSAATALVAALVWSVASLAQGRTGVNGRFSLMMMSHTSSDAGPLPGVNPWNGSRQPSSQRFAYRSIPCSGPAPVNNISSDLPSYNARVSGSRVPSSVRAHPFSFRVVRARGGGSEMRGAITFTVCKLASGATPTPDPIPDAQKPKIRVAFRATFAKTSVEEVHYSGTFRLIGGTGRYRDLTGAGRIEGYLFCFAPEGCRPGGKLLDEQYTLQGNFRDPTPQLTSP
jgi:hypothetical protein